MSEERTPRQPGDEATRQRGNEETRQRGSEGTKEKQSSIAADPRVGRSSVTADARVGNSPSDRAAPANASACDARESAAESRTDYADDLICPECGYSLRGISSPRCPECGLLLDFIEADRPVIPWESRHELGRVRAFLQTVRQVLRRPKVFCRAVYRPVDYYAAQKFRWICVLLFWGSLLGLTAIIHFLYPNMLPEAAEESGWWYLAWCGVCVLPALLAFTGIPSYFFHPRELPVTRQNRAIALSYYACAPLALGPIMILAAGIGLAIWKKGDYEYATWLIVGILCCVLLVSALEYWSAFAKCTLVGTNRRIWLNVLILPLWFVACGLILIGLPAVAYFLALVYYSLQPVRLGG